MRELEIVIDVLKMELVTQTGREKDEVLFFD